MFPDEIAWSDELAIGDPTVDAQHRALVDVLARLTGPDAVDEPRLLGSLLAQVSTHFADEEALMERVGYPALDEHRALHRGLVRTFLVYKREHDAGQHGFASLQRFVFRWLHEHIVEHDRRIGMFLRERGN